MFRTLFSGDQEEVIEQFVWRLDLRNRQIKRSEKHRGQHNRIDKAQEDQKILNIIQCAQQSDIVKLWQTFTFLVSSAGDLTQLRYVEFNIKNLAAPFQFAFLDRVKITLKENDNTRHATVVGEYQNQLYINFDGDHHAEPLKPFFSSHFTVTRSDATDYTSLAEFNVFYLGFYLNESADIERLKLNEVEDGKPHGFRFFQAKWERNATYVKQTKLFESSLPTLNIQKLHQLRAKLANQL